MGNFRFPMHLFFSKMSQNLHVHSAINLNHLTGDIA